MSIGVVYMYVKMCRNWSVREVLCIVSEYVVSACIIDG
jgi:hypothetical protein